MASIRASRGRGSRVSLIVAFAANVLVAAAKLAAGLITGSAALLAEAAHSAADSTNEILLGVSFRRARRPPDAEHPFGYGGLRFLWAFLAAISSFLIGGCLSVGLGINDLVHGNAVGDYAVAWIVLGIAAIADGSALRPDHEAGAPRGSRLGRVDRPLPAGDRAIPPCAPSRSRTPRRCSG